MKLGDFIRDKRKAKGMSIRQVALYAECSGSYLSMLERGVVGSRGPTPGFLRKLARPLGVPYEMLLEAAGYHVLTEDERLYLGVLVQMVRSPSATTWISLPVASGYFPVRYTHLRKMGRHMRLWSPSVKK